MNKVTRLRLEKNQTGTASQRTEIAELIRFKPRQPRRISKETRRVVASQGDHQTESTSNELDPGILDYLEEHLDDNEIIAIESAIFTKNPEYQKLREFLKDFNSQQFFNYLFQVKIEKLTPSQIQAILDEIKKRAI